MNGQSFQSTAIATNWNQQQPPADADSRVWITPWKSLSNFDRDCLASFCVNANHFVFPKRPRPQQKWGLNQFRHDRHRIIVAHSDQPKATILRKFNFFELKMVRFFVSKRFFKKPDCRFNSLVNVYLGFLKCSCHIREIIYATFSTLGSASGSTHLLCSLMRSTRRSTASASGMLNLIGVLPT